MTSVNEPHYPAGVYFSKRGQPTSYSHEAMRHSAVQLSPEQNRQRQGVERSNADALLPLARFKDMYHTPFMCEEEKRRRLYWLEREERQNLSCAYPWRKAQGQDLRRYHLAAIIIQSEFRAWRARQALRALKKNAEALKQEELARQRQSAVRLLRQQAKDLLLTLYAQGQYSKTRDRLMTTKGHSDSEGPSFEDRKIDARLWEKVRQLGLDPMEVLAEQMTTKQIKLVLNASSIHNSGMLPQRTQDLGMLPQRGRRGSRLLNAQDSVLTSNTLPTFSRADSSAVSGLLLRTGNGLLQSSAMQSFGSHPLHQLAPEPPPTPKLVLQLHDYSRLPKAGRPSILKLAPELLNSHGQSRGQCSPRTPELQATTGGSWVPSTIFGSKARLQAEDVSASADGPLLSRSSRRPASMAGSRLQAKHSAGDLLACSGKALSRTCRMSDSGVDFSLPRLGFKQ